jgi:hypothetical protein
VYDEGRPERRPLTDADQRRATLARAEVFDLLAWRRLRGRTVHDWPSEPCSGICMCWGSVGAWWNGHDLWTWAEAERSLRGWPA